MLSIFSFVRAWLRQPTTVAGISALSATGVAVALGQVSWTAALPLAVGSVVSILLPDNAGAKAAAVSLTQEVVAQVDAAQVNVPTAALDAKGA